MVALLAGIASPTALAQTTSQEPPPAASPAADPPAPQIDPQEALISRLVSVYRRLYVLADAPTRATVLLELLRDPAPSLRRLGLELARREVSSGAVTSPQVIDAAIGLLGDTDPVLRSQAATLIAETGDANAAGAIAEALLGETSPDAAAAMIRAASRWPETAPIDPIFAWLQSSEETENDSIASLWSIARAGRLDDDPRREAVASHLRSCPLDSMTGPALRLLARTGGADDRVRVASLLKSEDAPTRLIAAEALSDYPDYAVSIADAATDDPALTAAAVRAGAIDRPSGALLVRLASLPFETQDDADRAIATLIERSDASALLVAAEATASSEHRVRFAEAAVSRLGEAGATGHDAMAKALLLLARARINLGRPDEAIAALDQFDTLSAPDTELAEPLRLRALVSLSRFADAAKIEADASGWLDALESAPTSVLADAIRFFGTRFADGLTEGETARLAALIERLPTPEPETRVAEPEGEAPAEDAPELGGGFNSALTTSR